MKIFSLYDGVQFSCLSLSILKSVVIFIMELIIVVKIAYT